MRLTTAVSSTMDTPVISIRQLRQAHQAHPLAMLILAILLLSLLLPGTVHAGEKLFSYRTTLQGNFGLPFADYAMERGTGGLDADSGNNYQLDALMGGQLGSTWYLWENGTFGLALMINWFDIVQGASPLSIDTRYEVLDIGLLETGLGGSFKLAEHIAADIYYQARPSMLINTQKTDDFDYDTVEHFALKNEINRTGLGIGHTLGLQLRYDMFNIGTEFLFGGLPNWFVEGMMGEEGEIAFHPVMSIDPTLQTDAIRLLLGIQL